MASRYQQFMEYIAYCKCDINQVYSLARDLEYNPVEKILVNTYVENSMKEAS